MLPNLIKHICEYIELTEDDIEIIISHIELVSLKNKQYLLEEGQVCRYYYFVEKGCLRMFFYNDKSIEKTTQIAIENWWMTDYFSFSDQKPSEYYIQALEKSQVYAISHDSFYRLLKGLPVLERYFRSMMQRILAANQYRIKELYELSKEEMYNRFSTDFPQFVQRIPQYVLASYLGLTPEYVSEIRKKK